MSDDLRQQRDRFLAFAFANSDLLLEIDLEHRINFAAGASSLLLDVPENDLIGLRIQDVVAPGDWPTLENAFRKLQIGQRFGPTTVTLTSPAVEKSSENDSVVNVGGCRMPPNMNSIYLSVSDAYLNLMTGKNGNAAMIKDEESGLLSNESFTEAAKETIELAKTVNKPVQLTLLDVPAIGELRDRAGEDNTQHFFQKIGSYLRSRSVNETSGRLGDSRFSLLHDVAISSDEIRDDVRQLAQESDPTGQGIEVEASTVDIDPQLDEGDTGRALAYVVSSFANAGDGSFDIHSLTDAAQHVMDDTLSKIAEFKTAVREKRVRLFCQPIVDLKTEAVHHYEVLSRFMDNEDTFGVVSFAEEVGIIHELDLAIAESAFDLLTRYLPRTGDETTTTKLAINLSGRSLMSDIFINLLMNLLRENKGEEDRLLFEITESARIENLTGVNKVLQEIRGLGYKICLDDFGAGAASFQYINAFEVDFIKIDGSYVRGLKSGERESLMLASMTRLAKSLNIQTVAEMVETQEELSILRDIGVEFGQGYLFGKPKPIARLVKAADTVLGKATG